MTRNLLQQQVVQSARESLRLAANTLTTLSGQLGHEFLAATEQIHNSSELIVTTGVGKSGFVARKLAATLTSIGKPSAFLDPLSALHGDLGIVRPKSVVVAVSYSGGTEEILALAPALKHREAIVVAITGFADSGLARLSTISLLAQIEKEACPLNLAPTTSIIAALGVADAIAIGVMLYSNHQAEQFAVNHPAGRLGRRLTMTIRDMLEDSHADFISPDMPFSEVLTAITANKMGAVCVGDTDGRLIGIITDGDIRRALQQHSFAELEDIRAESFMTASPTVTYEDSLAADALNEMEERKSQISVLPVVNDDMQILGMVRVHDLIRAGI